MGSVGTDIDEAVAAFAASFDGDAVALARAASRLAELASHSIDDSLSAPALNTVVQELTSVSYAVAATLDVVVDRWDRAGAWAYDGALSGSGWMCDRFNTSRAAARGLIQNARRLLSIPMTFEMLRSGRISRPVALLLGQANSLLPEAFADAEAFLLEAIEGVHERHARQTIDTWIAAAKAMIASNDPDPEPGPEEPSFLSLSTLLDGRLRLEGEFDNLSGQLIRTAIENLSTKDDDTSRPSRERQAEALVALAKMGLDSGRAGTAQRPHIVVTMTLDDFERRTGTNAHFADGSPVPEHVLWDLFCSSDIHPLLTNATNTPLAMGRSIRLADMNQRLAMRLQWNGCGFPGCDQPYERCEAHHETLAWDDGGLTNAADMIPLCHGHHRLKHRAGWTIRMESDGTVRALRPDGHELVDTRRRIRPPEIPEPAIPEPAIPEVTIPEVTIPEAAIPEVTIPELAIPEFANPVAAVPDVAVPDVAPIVVSPLILINGWAVNGPARSNAPTPGNAA